MKAEKMKNTSEGTVHKMLTFSTFCTFLTPHVCNSQHFEPPPQPPTKDLSIF